MGIGELRLTKGQIEVAKRWGKNSTWLVTCDQGTLNCSQLEKKKVTKSRGQWGDPVSEGEVPTETVDRV